MLNHPETPTLQLLSVLNSLYLLSSGCGLVFCLLLRRDVGRDRLALSAVDRPDPRHVELVQNDLWRENWRVGKQTMVFVAIWLPLIIRPVLADNPDPFIYEFYRGCFALISMGLLVNSYRDLRFRKRFRAELTAHPSP